MIDSEVCILDSRGGLALLGTYLPGRQASLWGIEILGKDCVECILAFARHLHKIRSGHLGTQITVLTSRSVVYGEHQRFARFSIEAYGIHSSDRWGCRTGVFISRLGLFSVSTADFSFAIVPDSCLNGPPFQRFLWKFAHCWDRFLLVDIRHLALLHSHALYSDLYFPKVLSFLNGKSRVRTLF